MVGKINLKVGECVNDVVNISLSYKCLICKYIGNQNEMQTHVAEQHTHINGVIKYMCPFCDYVNHDHKRYIDHRENELSKLRAIEDENGIIPIPDGY